MSDTRVSVRPYMVGPAATHFVVPSGGGGPYVGPGDVQAATLWWGMRAYSFATIGTNLVQIKRDSNGDVQDFASLANGQLDIASIATFIAPAPGTGLVSKMYEQVAGSNHLLINNASPAYTSSGLNGFSVARFTIVNMTGLISTLNTTITQPLSILIVVNHTDTSIVPTQFIAGENCTVSWIGSATANNPYIYAGGGAASQGTASDNHWHSIVGTIAVAGTGTSNLYVDGSLNAGPTANTGTGDLNGLQFKVGNSASNWADMDMVEVAAYNSELGATPISSLHTNAVGFYGAFP